MASLVVILQSVILLTTAIGSRSGGRDGGTKEVISSLALGMSGLEMAGFGIMSMLTELAHNVGILIPTAGHIILHYALGAMVGAPIIALFSSHYSFEHTLLFLVTLRIAGNAVFTLFSSYLMLIIGRLVSGFPYDVLSNVSAVMLSEIIKPGKATAAVAGMVSGVAVANLLGIPLGTYLSQGSSWRYTFSLIAVFNTAVTASVYFRVSDIHDEAKGKLREQFHFLRSLAPWSIFTTTMFGSTGVFVRFSYVKPYMVFISGSSEMAMTLIMMLVGLGMVLGNMLNGKTSGRHSPLRIAAMTDFIIVLALLMPFLFGGMKTTSLIFAFIYCVGLFALSAPLRILLLQDAKDEELLSTAGGQIAFNLGSVIGTYCGGMMLTLRLVYNYMVLPAALPSFATMSLSLLYGRYKRQQVADSSVLAKPLGQIAVAVRVACRRIRRERLIRLTGLLILQA